MEPKVVRVEETLSLSTSGGTRKVFRVIYTVGEDGPFTLELGEADFTPGRIREALEKTAATLRAIH